MHLVCRLGLVFKLWTYLQMFSQMCFHTTKRSHSLTSHVSVDIHFYTKSSTIIIDILFQF